MFGLLAQLLAWCYDVVPNYGISITLFTLIVMIVVTPFTIKGMRSMAEMARLQPEMKKLQDQYKNDRVKMNEEMQALFKEHKVNPLGGCLPTLLPLPIFFIIFRLLRGMTAKHRHWIFNPQRTLNGLPNPHYLPHASSLYTHLVADNGKMISFGMDLGKAARENHGSLGAAIPFYALIVIMTASQYVQQQQMNKRNPQAANANPQMKITMQLFPAFYAVISLTIPASVVLYLLVSGLFRMAQNTLSYRYDPKMAAAMTPLAPKDKVVVEATSRAKGDRTLPPGKGRGDSGRSDHANVKDRGPKNAGTGGNGAGKAKPVPKTDTDDKVDDVPPKNGGPPKSAVNVRPGASRPATGRVTPRGGSRSRRGR
jgi:YidC/Oxa1 family membrane protein insertase